MKNKIRKISSVSGVITNSSTEVFIIWGESALKLMIGCGVFKKFKKDLLFLKTEEDVINFITESRIGYDHHYYRYLLNGVGSKRLIDLYDKMRFTFPERKEEILEFFKPEFIKEYKGSIFYYNYKNNGKIMKLLKNYFTESEGDNYKWTVD